MPNTTVPATGEAMPVANITRRAALAGFTATAAALATSTVPAEPATTPEELAAMVENMPPMERIFFKQCLYDWGEEDSLLGSGCSPEEFWDVHFKDWLSGFDQGIIDKFESGEWKA